MHVEVFNRTLGDLLRSCHRVCDLAWIEALNLEKKPLRNFSNEDIRQVMARGVLLDIMVPFALDILEENILAQGQAHAGDLLEGVLAVDESYWKDHGSHGQRLKGLLASALDHLQEKQDKFTQILDTRPVSEGL